MAGMFSGHIRKLALGLVCVALAFVVPPPTPAAACSCFGDVIQAAEEYGQPGLVFTGRVVETGLSNVTAEWFDPPRPGVAFLFEVDAVRVGELGATVVVHAPEGDGGGNCSIPSPNGQQLVVSGRDDLGYIRGGFCSIFPVAQAPDEARLTATFGPERAPDLSIEPETLSPGVGRPPDPDEPGGQAIYDQYDGVLVEEEASVEVEEAAATEPTENNDPSLALVVGLVGVAGLALVAGKIWFRQNP